LSSGGGIVDTAAATYDNRLDDESDRKVDDSGMIVDVDENVAHQQQHRVDENENENERTIEQGLD
jgi:hypothetical protein